jgi:hypothetical protein
MDTTTATPTLNYLNNGYGLKSWLLTKDHKRIALLYLWSITAFFFLGGFFALVIRLELLTPAADLVQPDTYNKMFTMHGVVMVFFFLIPSIPAVLGNFLLPIMIGAKDLAFPRINLLSWYIYVLGGLFTVAAAITGGVDTGWTFYAPYSTSASNSNVILAGVGIFITGFSSILTGLNFIVTVHRMRAPGLTWFRLPLFVWAHYATSLIMILGTPVIAITVLLVAVERGLHLGIFDPALGGDPILFQHLFWFYSHPAVYIMILPAMGVVAELVQAFSRKNIFGYTFVAFSSLAIAIIGFLVWGHHLFVAGPVDLRRAGVLDHQHVRRDSVRGEGVQLDGDDLQGLGVVGLADALRVRLHRPVHDRRADGAVPGDARHGHPHARHVLHHRALPLRDGRRRDLRVSRRPALLVAEDHRPDVSRGLGEVRLPQHLHRVQPDVRPAVPRRLSRDAAPLRDVRAGIPGVERPLDRGRHDPGRRLPDSDGLPHLVVEERAAGRRNPWGARGLEWEIPSPPPTENFAVTPIVTEGTHQYAPSREVGIV